MRVFKYLFFALLFLIILFFTYGFFFLEDKVQVTRSITIDRPAKTIFKSMDSMRDFNEWSPWSKLDPNTQYSYSGENEGAGSKMNWTSEQQTVGSGSQEITEFKPHEFIKYEIYFESQGDDPSWASFDIKENNGSSVVTWSFDSDFKGDVLKRYYGLMMDDMLGPALEEGLTNLKNVVEAKPVYDFSGFSVEQVSSQNVLYVGTSASSTEEASLSLANAYGQITNFMMTNAIDFAGMPLAITRSRDNDLWVFDAAIPVNIEVLEGETGDIQLGQTYAGKVVKYIQKGPYDQAEASYALLEAYLAEHELEKNGNSWDVYANDPNTVAKGDIETHIHQPIK